MNKQKRVLTIQDISCLGQCSITVALPILSAFGYETVILPTAVLSTHTAPCFSGFTLRDLTSDIAPISKHWKSLGISFDCIHVGYLCDGEQTRIVGEQIDCLRNENTSVIIDPAMADNGKLYPGFTPAHVQDMLRLCRKADIILPNMTEASFLAGESYDGNCSIEKAKHLIALLQENGCKSVVITSVIDGENLGVIARATAQSQFLAAFQKRENIALHGSGDVFASAFVGEFMKAGELSAAIDFAVSFTVDAIRKTLPYCVEHGYGVMFERSLPMILKNAEKDIERSE